MNLIQKSLVGAMMLTSAAAFSANNGKGGYWVADFNPNSWVVQSYLTQSVTGKNNSCGPTSLLFIDNHYIRKSSGSSPTYLLQVGTDDPVASNPSTNGTKAAINRLYDYLGQKRNTYTLLDQLKLIAKDKWGYTKTARMSGSATKTGPSRLSINMDNLISYMNQDIPVLAILSGNYAKNPVGKYDHIVIIFAYNRRTDEFGRAPLDPANTRNLDTIDWYEPYYGKEGTTLRREVLADGSKSAFNIAHFSFLAVGK